MHNTITEYKQMHNKTKKWQLNTYLYLFCGYTPSWVFSFIVIASFLIQMLRWIRSSSRFEFFIFLIAWGIFFGWWELDLQLLPYSLLFLWVDWKWSLPSGTHSLNEWISWSWEAIQGGHHYFCILHFCFKLFLIWETLMTTWSLHSRSSHSSTDFCSSLQIAWNR